MRKIMEIKQRYQREDKKKKEIESMYKFLPLRILELLGIDDKKEIELEEQVSADASVLTVNTKSFLELIQNIETREIFSYVNQILERLIPITLEQGGCIDKYIGGGYCAIYVKEHEKAMKTALAICEELKDSEKFSIGLCYGNVKIGIVGNRECLSTTTISEYTGMSEYLQTIASKYYARILITSSYATQIEDFEKKYAFRFLGYILIRSTNTMEKLYDVFAGDQQEDVWMKKKTRLMFEEGVRQYTSGKLEIARLHFIEVLKASRRDTAAKEYLYLCDYYLQKENRGMEKIYIESY